MRRQEQPISILRTAVPVVAVMMTTILFTTTAISVAAFAPSLPSSTSLSNLSSQGRRPQPLTRIFATEVAEDVQDNIHNTKDSPKNPRTFGLALALDEGTRQSHSMAENTAFVTGFFKGLSTRQSYTQLLTSLYFVYHKMESSLDDLKSNTSNSNTHHVASVLDDAQLRRLASLEQDLKYFYDDTNNENWKSQIQPSPATRTYMNRIQQIASDPEQSYLLVAHQYTRYLGDLFGGQMMGNMARRSLDLNNNDDEHPSGTAFYKFQDIANVQEYITGWYTRLNALELTAQQKQAIVDEANLVFALNIGILQELEGSPFQAMWTLAVNTLKTTFMGTNQTK